MAASTADCERPASTSASPVQGSSRPLPAKPNAMPSEISRSLDAEAANARRPATRASHTTARLMIDAPRPIRLNISPSNAVRSLKCESTPRAACTVIQVISKTSVPSSTGDSRRQPGTRVRARSHRAASAMVIP